TGWAALAMSVLIMREEGQPGLDIRVCWETAPNPIDQIDQTSFNPLIWRIPWPRRIATIQIPKTELPRMLANDEEECEGGVYKRIQSNQRPPVAAVHQRLCFGEKGTANGLSHISYSRKSKHLPRVVASSYSMNEAIASPIVTKGVPDILTAVYPKIA